jgi:hypothetical protein
MFLGSTPDVPWVLTITRNNRSMTSLDLGENSIGTEGGNLLGDAVKRNRRLKRLVWQSTTAGKSQHDDDDDDDDDW